MQFWLYQHHCKKIHVKMQIVEVSVLREGIVSHVIQGEDGNHKGSQKHLRNTFSNCL